MSRRFCHQYKFIHNRYRETLELSFEGFQFSLVLRNSKMESFFALLQDSLAKWQIFIVLLQDSLHKWQCFFVLLQDSLAKLYFFSATAR